MIEKYDLTNCSLAQQVLICVLGSKIRMEQEFSNFF